MYKLIKQISVIICSVALLSGCTESDPIMKEIGNKGKLIICSVALLPGCTEPDPIMKDIGNKGKLIILTRNSPSTYYYDAEGSPVGFEYDLSKALADSLNVEVEYKLFDSIDGILHAMNKGEGHLAAAGLTLTDKRAENFIFGPSYKTVQQQVVCHRKANIPENVEALKKRSLLIIAESSYEESLKALQVSYPELSWQSTNELSTEQVLEKVMQKEVDCTVADSNIIAINRRYYPELVVAFPLSEPQELAWILPNDSEYFKEYVFSWLEQVQNNSNLDIINERYYGYADIFDYYDNYVFHKRIKTRLPKYQKLFQKAVKPYPFSWSLLAAQAYQESGWKAGARSPTGVRGLMMLTRNTAKSLGVTNRLDPQQSIEGGAKYLDKMMKRIPEEVAAEDKVWFAFAAYNVGFAHLRDARKLAVQLGKNPNTWSDMKSVLPLLSQKQYYKTLRYGYARGSEPVRYIDRIRYYHDVLLEQLSKE